VVLIALLLLPLVQSQAERNSEYEILVQRAIRKLKEKDWKGADEEATKAVHLRPDAPFAYSARAHARSNLGLKKQAIEDLDQVILKLPQDADSWRRRGLLHHAMGELDKAHEDLTQALKRGPANPTYLAERAGIRLKKRDFAGAEQDCSQAILIEASTAAPWIIRGKVRAAQGLKEAALSDFAEAIRLEPSNPWPYFDRSLFRLSAREFKLALEDADQAVRLDPDNPMTLVHRIDVKLALDDLDGAMADCSEALKRLPTTAKLWLKRADLHLKKDDHAAAERDLDESIRIEPAFEAFAIRGTLRGRRGANEESVSDFTEALKLQPDNVSALSARGLAFRRLGDLKAALGDASKALSLTTPPDPALQAERGIVNYHLAEYAAALVDLDPALAAKSDNPEWLTYRGECRSRLGDLQGAELDFTAALKIAPNREDAHCGLAHLRHRQGRLEEARAHLEDARRMNPKSPWAAFLDAALCFARREWPAAAAAYRNLIESHPKDAGYWRLYIWIARCRMGEEREAGDELRAAFSKSKEWPAAAASFHLRDLTEPQLFAEASRGEKAVSRTMAAHFHAGVRRLRDGDAEGARTHFTKCIESKLYHFAEFTMAEDELRALDKK
jgi:tetratricopeptide (TPR) repeat protein